MKILRGKRAMVTGAASGIGRALALAMAAEGVHLYLIDIDDAGLAATAREVGKYDIDVVSVRCDLCNAEEVTATVRALLSAWGRLDILINNAGVSHYGATHAMTDAEWTRLFAVNLMAPIQLVRQLLPTLLASDDAHIVNMCSILGLATGRQATAYQASKYGLVGFTLALRTEYDAQGFGVTAVCPGVVTTPMMGWINGSKPTSEGEKEKLAAAIPRWLYTSPERVATAALAGIRRNKAIVVVSPAAWFLWLLSRFSPSLLDWLLREGWRRRRKIAIEQSSLREDHPVP